MSSPRSGEKIVFVTGRLAAPALRSLVERLREQLGFDPVVIEAKISVAALMTPDWLVGKLRVPEGTSRVVLPGLCNGATDSLQGALGVPVVRGPKDFRELPDFFGRGSIGEDYRGDYDIEILAEINHANRLSNDQVFEIAQRYRTAGADVIDLGGTPGEEWSTLADCVAGLVERGHRVSIDSFDPDEVALACQAGAELVLSVNAENVQHAQSWGREVVVVPEQLGQGDWLSQMERTIERLDRDGIRFRLDPVLEPIGMGFAASLDRYLRTREHFPACAMMMGVGNLTEMTQVDSAGVNMLLMGFCQELAIGSVLTTQVIHWAQNAIAELSIARRMVAYAVRQHIVPKHYDGRLVMLLDGKPIEQGDEELRRQQGLFREGNFRIHAERGKVVVMNDRVYLEASDPFALFAQMGVADPGHAFYLGWELMKASLAAQLNKRYLQDQPLEWGMLTRAESTCRHGRSRIE